MEAKTLPSLSAAIDFAYAEWEGKNILMDQRKGYLKDVI